jgi:hypothetical protein
MQIVEFFSKYKGLSSMSYGRESSTIALLDFSILISKRPIHQELSWSEGVHHYQVHEHYHLARNQIEFICSQWDLLKSSRFQIPRVKEAHTLKFRCIYEFHRWKSYL